MTATSWVRGILDLVEESLDEPDLAAPDLAARAYLSRYHFDRLVRAALGEPPGAFRRRLLLERAAHRLVGSLDRVIAVAADAGYASPDAFTRAFVRAYGCTPSEYRRRRANDHDLPALNGIHFHPPGGLRLPATERSDTMDVLVRMYDHHVELTAAILDRLTGLPDAALDEPIDSSIPGIDRDPTLRSIAARLVGQLEMWVAAVDGATSVPNRTSDPTELRARLSQAAAGFRSKVVEPIEQGRGGDTFLDGTCDPPETFSLGGVIAHVLTFAAVRRTMAIGALEAAGVDDLGSGDPMRCVGDAGQDASAIRRNFA